jgi:phosphoglycolate phosphatase
MTSPNLRLAVFDLDGTLVDSQHVIVGCMTEAFTGEGLPAPAVDAIRRVIGLPLEECVARLAPEETALRCARLVEAYKAAFFACRQRPDHDEPLFLGALEALAALEAEGWLLGIATGKAMRGLRAVLERHDLARRFVTLQTADMNPGKPNPAMLEKAMAEAGVARADTVMIGDTTFDMLMARSAGVLAIGVEWGNHPPHELREAGAHALVGSYAELPDAVLRLTKGNVGA